MTSLDNLIESARYAEAFSAADQIHAKDEAAEKINLIADSALKKAKEIKGNDTKAALALYALVMENKPRAISAWLGYGNLLISTENYDEAESFFGDVIERFPKNPAPYLRYAHIARCRGELETALERYDNALKQFPEDPRIVSAQKPILFALNRRDPSKGQCFSPDKEIMPWAINERDKGFLYDPEHGVRSVAALSGGVVVVASRYNRIYLSSNHGETFELLAHLEPDSPQIKKDVCRLHTDSEGHVYYSSRSLKKLYRMNIKEKTFQIVMEDLGCITRGFVQTKSGYRLAGRYDQKGPAVLLGSADGISWEKIRQWDARHIHDIRMNPENGWIYIVMGEGDEGRSRDSHSILRSKDDGRTFDKIYQSQGRRPLFTAINFHGSTVILGTDHFETDNYIAAFKDDGSDQISELKQNFSIPALGNMFSIYPFVYFIERIGGHFFVGVRGFKIHALFTTSNFVDWHYVRVGHDNSFTQAAVSPDGDLYTVGDFFHIGLSDEAGPLPTFRADGASSRAGWGPADEELTRQALIEIDPEYRDEICKGYFYRAVPLFEPKYHFRESLVFLLNNQVPGDGRILDVGTGTGQLPLYLARHGFKNLHGWDHNQRWLTAADYIFKKFNLSDTASFSQAPKEAIYDIQRQSGNLKYHVITMFSLIYGHDIEVEKVWRSVSNALVDGGYAIANDLTYEIGQMRQWIIDAGMRVKKVITIYGEEGKISNNIYFAQKIGAWDKRPPAKPEACIINSSKQS